MVDFIVECSTQASAKKGQTSINKLGACIWIGRQTRKRQRRHVLVTSKVRLLCFAVCLTFKATNKEAEYEAVLADFGMVKELHMDSLNVFNDTS